jgi:hypothetical protein
MSDPTTTTYPIEYQVFALSLRQPGAIAYFKENLNPEIVGINDNQLGIHELYNALISYSSRTELDIVDAVAFRNWIQLESNVYQALNGDTGVTSLMSVLDSMQLATPESVTQVLKHKDNKIKLKEVYSKNLNIVLTF